MTRPGALLYLCILLWGLFPTLAALANSSASNLSCASLNSEDLIQDQIHLLLMESLGISLPHTHPVGIQEMSIKSNVVSSLDPKFGDRMRLLTYVESKNSPPRPLAFFRPYAAKKRYEYLAVYPWPHPGSDTYDQLIITYLKASYGPNGAEYEGTHPVYHAPLRVYNPLKKHTHSIFLFPWVYPFESEYARHLLDQALRRISPSDSVLVLGTGAGGEAISLAKFKDMSIDATDINPIAVANTRINAMYTQTDHLVNAWVSDGLESVSKRYDKILFNAPLAVEWADRLALAGIRLNISLYDPSGRLLRRVFSNLVDHLNPGGSLLLMSHQNIKKYLPSSLRSRVLDKFKVKDTPLAIHEVSVK